eukprot:c18935_g1_i1 orf=299-1399(-)
MVACELSKRHPPEALRCPRCDSADTKFCYYNNYNTSQPRHFCKSCKRYWTAGGSLRNVPVGGGLRKNKKSKVLNHVKDMITSPSAEEHFHGSLPLSKPHAFPPDGFAYEATPRPLSFTSPLFMASPSSSADVAGDGNLANPYAFRNLNPFGYFIESRHDGDYAVTGMDPSLLNSMDARQHAQYHGDYCRTLPEGMQQRSDGSLQCLRVLAGADQAQSHSGGASEVPSEPSQASSEVVKDPQSSHMVDLHQTDACQLEQGQTYRAAQKQMHGEEQRQLHGEGSADAGMAGRQQSARESDRSRKQENVTPPSEELMLLQDNQLRDRSSTEGEEDELGNVVNVRYPYDWEQVSEVLFGGTPDFFQLSSY